MIQICIYHFLKIIGFAIPLFMLYNSLTLLRKPQVQIAKLQQLLIISFMQKINIVHKIIFNYECF